MKILHTADWHLNERLGRIPRQKDIADRLREIAFYLDEYEVDVMIVAGDLFSRFMRYDELENAFKDAHDIFKPFLLRGGTILAISGNHDTEALFSILRLANDLASPIDPSQQGPRPNGRLYLAPEPAVIPLIDKTGLPVQFVLMPYPTPETYLDGQSKFKSLDERNRILQQKFAQRLRDIQSNRDVFDLTKRSVLITHIYVRGVEVNAESRRELSEAEEVPFNLNDMPTGWDYVACGHIHRPQMIGNMPHVRYAGSVERLDAGESQDEKSVVLLEIGPSGCTTKPQILPLHATPIYHVEIENPETELPHMKERYPNHEQAIVSCHMTYTPGGVYSPDDILRTVEQIFPRIYREHLENTAAIYTSSNLEHDFSFLNVPGTVIHYLETQLKEDPDRDEILALAAEMLANKGSVQ